MTPPDQPTPGALDPDGGVEKAARAIAETKINGVASIRDCLFKMAFITGTPWNEETFSRDMRTVALAALRTPPTPAREAEEAANAPRAAAYSPFVCGPVWQEDEEAEDGGELWTAEVQIIGGFAVVATVYGSSLVQVIARQSAVVRALALIPPGAGEASQAGGGG